MKPGMIKGGAIYNMKNFVEKISLAECPLKFTGLENGGRVKTTPFTCEIYARLLEMFEYMHEILPKGLRITAHRHYGITIFWDTFDHDIGSLEESYITIADRDILADKIQEILAKFDAGNEWALAVHVVSGRNDYTKVYHSKRWSVKDAIEDIRSHEAEWQWNIESFTVSKEFTGGTREYTVRNTDFHEHHRAP